LIVTNDSPIRRATHSFEYDVEKTFPNARPVKGWEGGVAWCADRGGKPVLIIDERTMADFLDQNDPRDREIMAQLVSVLEFEGIAERELYMARFLHFAIEL
jgi:hypothetical protein